MSAILWVTVIVAVIVLLLVGVLVWGIKRRGWKGMEQDPDYRAFFWIGLIWVIFSVPCLFLLEYPMPWLPALGVIYLAIGLGNKDKWGKRGKITPEQKRMRMIAVAACVALLVIGLAAFVLFL